MENLKRFLLNYVLSFCLLYTRGGQPKLVSGPQFGKISKNIKFLDRMVTKNWGNIPKISKNRWFSIRVWAVEISYWAAGWPPLLCTAIIKLNTKDMYSRIFFLLFWWTFYSNIYLYLSKKNFQFLVWKVFRILVSILDIKNFSFGHALVEYT